jgi:hypothetical protein
MKEYIPKHFIYFGIGQVWILTLKSGTFYFRCRKIEVHSDTYLFLRRHIFVDRVLDISRFAMNIHYNETG